MTLPYYRDPGLGAWVDRLLERGVLDCVFVYSSAMAQYAMGDKYAMGDRGAAPRRVIDFVDVDSDKWRQLADLHAWPRRWIYRRESRRLLAFERRVAARFDTSLFVSPAEATLFRELAPEQAHKTVHIRNGVDADFFSPERPFEDPYAGSPHNLVFTGMMDYRPNVDAVTWFARRVLPRVRDRCPDAGFAIVGARPDRRVRALGRLPGVTVAGRVADVRPYLAHAALAVAPLRVGRGIQNKVLEAMAMAKAVVATPQALAGIEAEAGREILVASDAPAFADAVLSLLEAGERDAIGRRARARMIADYDWPTSLARLEAVVEGAAERQRR
jgi:sugar transferase (PEP-CTERM/EpsH1 system associated)